MDRHKRITEAELKSIVADYAAIFEGWKLFDGVSFFREEGPVRQMVWFEALRTGDYRPLCIVGASVMPTVRMLPKMLDVRNRTATLMQHAARKKAIENAMKEQFLPTISKPIDLNDVLRLCLADALEKTNDLAMLAILNAWLGKLDIARNYCLWAVKNLSPSDPIPEWEMDIKVFCKNLTEAIDIGAASDFLKSSIRKLQVSGT